MNTSIPHLTVVRDAGEPLGLFFRLGKNDHTTIKQLLSEGRVGFLGTIFDPRYCEFQQELRKEILLRNLDAILDPYIMELATVGGHASSRNSLPWASPHQHITSDFAEVKIDTVIEQIVKFVIEKDFNAVLAPSHFLSKGPKDPWLAIDRKLVVKLKQRLDAHGRANVKIYYPLAIPANVFVDPASRAAIKASLTGLPLNAIWLRIHSFGSGSSDTKLQGYISACHDFHSLNIPLVAEKTGVLGLALLAFGAVAGVESGVGTGEKFDFMRLKRVPSSSSKFAQSVRIYLPDLATFLTRAQAKEFFEHRGLLQFACRDTNCCRNGFQSMIRDNRRHFAYTRMGEVDLLSRITPSVRPVGYLEQILRPATDRLGRALAQDGLSDSIKKKLENSRRIQDGWRATLGEMSRDSVTSYSAPIERQVRVGAL